MKDTMALKTWLEECDPAKPQELAESNDETSTLKSSSKRTRSMAEESGIFGLLPPTKRKA
jgi:hypothetical protein